MIKFFRKHNNKMLVVFMSLLLVVWLGSEALQAMFSPDPSRVVEATTRDGEIKRGDVMYADRLGSWLRRVGLSIESPSGGLSQAGPLSNYEWVMLSREARRAGFATRPDEAAAFLTALGFDENYLSQVANREGITLERLQAGVAEFMDVRKAIGMVLNGASMSEAEIRSTARKQYEQVTAGLVTIKAGAFLDPEATFTDTEIREQFDKFREQKPGTGLNFGYFVAPKIKIQFCKIDVGTIQANNKLSEKKLRREARDYWKGDREAAEFRRPFASPPLPPGLGADLPYYLWEEAKPIALEAVRKREAVRLADRIANSILQQAIDPWLASAEGPDRFKVMPQGAGSAELYEKYAIEATGISPLPEEITIATTDWLSARDVGQAADIGGAFLPDARGGSRNIGSIAFRVQGLVDISEDASSRDLLDLVSLHETYRAVLRDADDNRYVFRVLAVDPEHAPETVDEVREQIIADLRIAKAFEAAKEHGEELAGAAKKYGIEQAWTNATELQEKVGDDQGGYMPRVTMSRASQAVPGLGLVDEGFLEQVFELGDWSEGREQWASIPIPDLATVAVVEWQELRPLLKTSYPNQRRIIVQVSRFTRQQKIVTEWLDPKNIRERNKFEFVR